MPHGTTKFQTAWLSAIDSNGQIVRDWCRRGKDDYHAYCRLCDNDFKCDNSGRTQILQHAKGKVHRRLVSPQLDKSQSKLVFLKKEPGQINSRCNSVSSGSENVLKINIHGEDVLKAECIWAAQVASANYSFRSCDGLKGTFSTMFYDSKIATDFKMNRTKVSYLLTDAMGPHFKRALIDDLNVSDSNFTLHFDETTQAQVKKQMDLKLRYWSPLHNEVWCRFYRALFFGHAEGEKVAQNIVDAFIEDKVPLGNLISLGMDGPNVNKTIVSKLGSFIKAEVPDHKGIIDIGSCNIHIIHNSFGKGLDGCGNGVEQLCMDLYYLFKYSAARREDYKFTQLDFDVEANLFQKHTEVRWLSLGPSVTRLLEQWDPITKFIKELGKCEKTAPKSANFKRIQTALMGHPAETLLEVLFLENVFPLFSSFLLVFQTEAPMIHVLYDKMQDVVVKLMNRFVKADVMKDKTGAELVSIDCGVNNQLPDDEIVIGDKVRKQLSMLKAEQQKRELLSIRAFFRNATEHLVKRLPLSNSLLASLGCLNPATPSYRSIQAIQEVTRKLEPGIDIAAVTDEWKFYVAEHSTEHVEYHDKCQRIDHYWRDVFKKTSEEGKQKYPCLVKVVKTALVLPHGNADVERSLSVNVNVVTKERCQLGEKTINAIRMMKDTVQFHDPKQNRPEAIPFSKDLFVSLKSAHAMYQNRLAEEKLRQEAENQRRKDIDIEGKRLQMEREKMEQKYTDIKSREKKLLEAEKSAKAKVDAANDLMKHGQDKLDNVLKEKNIDRQSLSVAQMMIETASNKIKETLKEVETVRCQQRKMEEEKNTLCQKNTVNPSQHYNTDSKHVADSKNSEHGHSTSKKHSHSSSTRNHGTKRTAEKESLCGRPKEKQKKR